VTGNAEHFQWADRPCEHLRGGVTRRYVTSDRVMIGEVTFQAGDTVPPHAHDSEQFTHVVRGALRFRLGTDGREEVLVRTGEVILVPSGVLHSVEAVEDTLEYDVFTPPRLDWTDPRSTFLRGGATSQ